MSVNDTEVIAENELCRITLTSSSFQFLTGYLHEVYDTERGELLSQWKSSDNLMERLDDVDHRLADEFREWYGGRK